MDNNFYSEMPMQSPQPQQPVKPKSKFGSGIAVGILIGMVATVLVCIGIVALHNTFIGGYLILGHGKSASVKETTVLDKDTVDKVEEVTSYIDLYYNDEVDEELLRDKLVAGMVEGLGDPYSVYYTAEEYSDLQVSTSGTYYGIGAALSQNPDTKVVTVTRAYKGTPAEEAGLMQDDIIMYVDDIDSTTEDLTSLVQKIRGEEGTTVHLQVYRPSTKETLELDVERRNVELPSIDSKMIDDKIGYIQITEFQSKTAVQFAEALEQLQKDGMVSLIVDLRDNPGGLLTSVTEILDGLLPKGTVVYTEDKYGEKNVFSSDASCVDFPIAVLVNGNSASASEIFAGAIKDYGYGTLIGTKTFGKGIVQTIFPLEDGDALKVTTAKYFTPKGNFIHGVGIEPDINLEYEYSGDKKTEYDMSCDNQVNKAIEVLNEKMDK